MKKKLVSHNSYKSCFRFHVSLSKNIINSRGKISTAIP